VTPVVFSHEKVGVCFKVADNDYGNGTCTSADSTSAWSINSYAASDCSGSPFAALSNTGTACTVAGSNSIIVDCGGALGAAGVSTMMLLILMAVTMFGIKSA